MKLKEKYTIFSEPFQQEMEDIFFMLDLPYIVDEMIALVETTEDKETLINKAKELLYEVGYVSGSDEDQIFTVEYVRETRQKLDDLAVQLTNEMVAYVAKQAL